MAEPPGRRAGAGRSTPRELTPAADRQRHLSGLCSTSPPPSPYLSPWEVGAASPPHSRVLGVACLPGGAAFAAGSRAAAAGSRRAFPTRSGLGRGDPTLHDGAWELSAGEAACLTQIRRAIINMTPTSPVESEDHKLRPLYCELNILSKPDGSAVLTQGETAVIAGVYGPIEVKPNKILIEKAYVEAVYRPKCGLPFVSDRMTENTLQNTLEAAILTTQYPRTQISISVQEMQDSGGLLACAINAGCLALMNTGLSMKFLIAAIHCMVSNDGEVILDPNEKQLKESCASLTFAFDNIEKKVVSSCTYGRFTETQYQEALLKCRSACEEIFQLYRKMVTKYAPAMG